MRYVRRPIVIEDLKRDQAWNSKPNQSIAKTSVPFFVNLAVSNIEKDGFAATHYVGIAGVGEESLTLTHHNNKTGAFGYNRALRFDDVSDGTSNTICVTETSAAEGPWMAGGTATIRALTSRPYINGADGIGSPFSGGLHVLRLDGSARFVSDSIDPEIFEATATVQGGEQVLGF